MTEGGRHTWEDWRGCHDSLSTLKKKLKQRNAKVGKYVASYYDRGMHAWTCTSKRLRLPTVQRTNQVQNA